MLKETLLKIMEIGVLDLTDDTCEELSRKYSLDRDATQLLIFRDCEKQGGISLEGDYKEALGKLKEMLEEKHEE